MAARWWPEKTHTGKKLFSFLLNLNSPIFRSSWAEQQRRSASQRASLIDTLTKTKQKPGGRAAAALRAEDWLQGVEHLPEWLGPAQETETETDPKVSNYLLYYLLYLLSSLQVVSGKKVCLCSKKKTRKKKEWHGGWRRDDCVRQQGISGELFMTFVVVNWWLQPQVLHLSKIV